MARHETNAVLGSVPVHVLDRARDRPPPVSHPPFVLGEVFLAALVGSIGVLVRMHAGPLVGDAETERWWQHLILPHASLTNLLEALSTINWPVPAAITLGVVSVLFLLLRRWLDAIVVILCAAVTDEATYGLSRLVHRARPSGHGIHILTNITTTYSFPSGHVVHATAVFGLLLFLTFQIRRPLPAAPLWLVRAALLFVILGMGLSRLVEGEHWPSDVVAGYVWGLFWLVIWAHIYLWMRHRFPRLLARDER